MPCSVALPQDKTTLHILSQVGIHSSAHAWLQGLGKDVQNMYWAAHLRCKRSQQVDELYGILSCLNLLRSLTDGGLPFTAGEISAACFLIGWSIMQEHRQERTVMHTSRSGMLSLFHQSWH